MTRSYVQQALRAFVRDWAIDPHDAGMIWAEVGPDGIDRETFGDMLDGAGYPELATEVYAAA